MIDGVFQKMYRMVFCKGKPVNPSNSIEAFGGGVDDFSGTPKTSQKHPFYMDVSKNNGTPKSSILIGFSIINHPFWGTPIFGNTHMASSFKKSSSHIVHEKTPPLQHAISEQLRFYWLTSP